MQWIFSGVMVYMLYPSVLSHVLMVRLHVVAGATVHPLTTVASMQALHAGNLLREGTNAVPVVSELCTTLTVRRAVMVQW